jgi:DNA repair photolyase
MSLSNQVKESVNQATESLRDALAFAARAEHPITINTLSDILIRLESLEAMEDIMQKFGSSMKTSKE